MDLAMKSIGVLILTMVMTLFLVFSGPLNSITFVHSDSSSGDHKTVKTSSSNNLNSARTDTKGVDCKKHRHNSACQSQISGGKSESLLPVKTVKLLSGKTKPPVDSACLKGDVCHPTKNKECLTGEHVDASGKCVKDMVKNPQVPIFSGSCNNFNFQTQLNTGSNMAGQQGSKNRANQNIIQSQSNTQNACITPIEKNVVKKYIQSNPTVQKQVLQSLKGLIQLDVELVCRQLGDKACIFANSNFKILFIQTTKDNLGNWVLNGEAQNIATNPINNVTIKWHLYDAQGNIIGLTQGLPMPSNLGVGQTTIMNLQEKPTDLTGTPKFYTVSFDFPR